MIVYQTLTYTTAAPHGLNVGDTMIAAGWTPVAYNLTAQVIEVVGPTVFKIGYYSSVDPGVVTIAGTVTKQGPTLVRQDNEVTATSTTPHGFAVGFQVSISGVANTAIGTIAAAPTGAVRAGGIATITTTTAHGIPVGARVAITGVTDASFDNPGAIVLTVPTPTSFTYANAGTDTTSGTGTVQDVWNGNFNIIDAVPSATKFSYHQLGPNDQTAGAGVGTVLGQVAAGSRGCVVVFLTRQGALTAPSPEAVLNVSGNKQILVTDIPIGPANVVARLLAFTPSGGANYFAIPALPAGGGTATLIPDNTTTSVVVDFADNTLQASFAIDVAGNNLFDQVVLGPVLGFFSFASRLIAWGDYNKIENFLNMGFCGGYLNGVLTTPLGWDTGGSAGGTLVNGGPWAAGMSWQITGDGTAAAKGQISQGAYEDRFGVAILSPNTDYDVRIWAKASANGLAGALVVEIYSASAGGAIGMATFLASTISTAGGFLQVNLGLMPVKIPSDAVLRVYAQNLPNGATVTISEVELVFVISPYRNTQARVSYTINPEAFAQTTGNIGASDDDSPIRCFTRQRNSALLETGEGVHIFQDNTSEPFEWSVNSLSQSVGAVSLRAGDAGKFGTGDAAEDWTLIAAKNGLFLFAGSEFWKVSQEISKGAGLSTALTWDDINWAAQQTIWVKNDPGTRRAYVGVPVNGALSPNLVWVLDYREMDTATQIASALPLHITLAGKMKSSDMTRKWSRWNIKANSGEVLVRPGNQRTLFLAGGNGLAIGQGNGFGNIYSLDPAKFTDDDYGAMTPYYTTYAFVDHDQEQALQLGNARHLYRHIAAFVSGIGLITITPLVNSLLNPLPATSPRQLVADSDISNAQANDLEWTVGIRGQRVFFKIQVQPLPGATDVKMNLQKLIVRMMKDPVATFRGSEI